VSTLYASRTRPGHPVQVTPAGQQECLNHLGFRPDIEGLRAVAVLLVVLSHAGVSALKGGYVGVDVFFVISGFLITSLLLRELTPGGSISIARFYARRAARLLPASTLVLVVTVAAAWFWLPPVRFPSILRDALASTFYGINYRLAISGTDYLNATAAPSPLQHFWSLAVEEQFYLVWPVLLLTAGWAWRGHRTMNRTPIVIALLALTAFSFAASVQQTGTNAPWAYFGGHTRAWELAVGALLALGAGGLARSPRALAAALTWIGLGAVVAAAVLFDERTPFPGHAAALPVAGAALIIAGGCAAPRGGAGLLLNQAPGQLIGKLSYGWYLWHWPVLMIAPSALDTTPGVWLNLALCAGALLVAAGSYAWVEQPIRHRRSLSMRPVRGIGLGLALSGVAAAAAVGAGTLTPALSGGGPVLDTASRLAAAADLDDELTALVAAGADAASVPANLTPALPNAAADKALISQNGCSVDFAATEARQCVFGDETSSTTVVLFGDSHAAHWFPALARVVDSRGWKLVSITKDACPAPTMPVYQASLNRAYTECDVWRERALVEVEKLRPSLVVLSSSEMHQASKAARDTDAEWERAWSGTLRRIRASEAEVVLINDTPRPEGNAVECVSSHLTDLTACARDRDRAIPRPQRRRLVATAAAREGAEVIDPLPWFCTERRCPAIVGNTLVYRDDSHITATYARLLAPMLDAALPS
jgi:peptidoglycan/LPS O-acetylase OafA/YrhL